MCSGKGLSGGARRRDPAPGFPPGELEAALLDGAAGRCMLTPRLLARATARHAFESPFTRGGHNESRTEKHREKAPSRGPNTAELRRRSSVIKLVRIVRAALVQTLDLPEAKAHARRGEGEGAGRRRDHA